VVVSHIFVSPVATIAAADKSNWERLLSVTQMTNAMNSKPLLAASLTANVALLCILLFLLNQLAGLPLATPPSVIFPARPVPPAVEKPLAPASHAQ
jgi:hypothetical protein